MIMEREMIFVIVLDDFTLCDYHCLVSEQRNDNMDLKLWDSKNEVLFYY